MNVEIERKYRVKNIRQIKNMVVEIGGVPVDITNSQDFYYKVPQKKSNTKYLRVRTRNGNKNGTLAYHEVIDDFTTNEWETDVADSEVIHDILIKLGFQLGVAVIKKREKFVLNGNKILLDEVEKLGNFIEIETTDKESLELIVMKLDLKEGNIVSGAGYPDLLKQKLLNS